MSVLLLGILETRTLRRVGESQNEGKSGTTFSYITILG